MPTEPHLRRVGFRGGTDEELIALHAVEAPIAAEQESNRMPQPVEAYVAFARALPSQFDDHAWLVEAPDRAPMAAAFCWSNSAGDERVMECDVLVRREHRRQGIGSRLLAAICDEAMSDGRSVLTWSTFDAVPGGDAFSRRVRARAGRVNRRSDLVLADVDWELIDAWAEPEDARRFGYRLETVEGVFPKRLRRDAAAFHRIMQTAPREDLDVGDVVVHADFVAELDRALLEAGRTRWTVLVRDRSGACVGGTEVTFESREPSIVHQQNTGIDRAHRGVGLAKWAKAATLRRIRVELPSAQRVRTENASTNAAMLAINEAIGFAPMSTRTEWQANPWTVHAALS